MQNVLQKYQFELVSNRQISLFELIFLVYNFRKHDHWIEKKRERKVKFQCLVVGRFISAM